MNETHEIMSMSSSNSTKYCDLDSFSLSYRSTHGYLSIFVSVFGSIANILNVFILSSKDMRMPTNFILTGLALSDLFVMLEYIPYSLHVYLNSSARLTEAYFSYRWVIYMYFHALFTQVCHFISCCLTLILAVWRYIALTHPQYNKLWCNAERTKISIFLTYLFCPFICTPLFMGLSIQTMFDRESYPNGTIIQQKDVDKYTGPKNNITLYVLHFNESYTNLNLWIYGVVIKLFPCILLTILSMFLIKALLDSKKRWKSLANSSGIPLINGDAKKQKNLEKNQQVDRTTRMLLAVLLLFLLTEFPQAMLGLLSGILGNEFCKQCYIPLGDLMDMFALTNSAINFILYCSMSQQFRTAFHDILLRKICTCLHRSKGTQTNDKMRRNTELTEV